VDRRWWRAEKDRSENKRKKGSVGPYLFNKKKEYIGPLLRRERKWRGVLTRLRITALEDAATSTKVGASRGVY